MKDVEGQWTLGIKEACHVQKMTQRATAMSNTTVNTEGSKGTVKDARQNRVQGETMDSDRQNM